MEYKWKILTVAWFINFTMWAGDILPAILKAPLYSDLGMQPEYYAFIISLPILMMVIFSIPVGMIVTKIGTKKTAMLGIIIALTGGALRGIFNNVETLTFFTAIYGIGMAVIFPNLPKIAESEFSRAQQGLASGIYMSGLPAGAILALIGGNFLLKYAAWQWIFVCYAFMFLITIPLWIHEAKDVPSNFSAKHGLLQVGKNLRLWLLSIANLTLLITYFGATTYLPSQPQLIDFLGGLTPDIIAAISASLILGLLFLPAISRKIGEKIAVITYQILTSVFLLMFTLSVVSGSMWVWAFSLLTGFFIGGTIPLYFAFLSRIGIPRKYFGIGSGIFVSILNIGGFIAPLLARYADTLMGIYGVMIILSFSSLTGATLSAILKLK